jgi:hypothetical protein
MMGRIKFPYYRSRQQMIRWLLFLVVSVATIESQPRTLLAATDIPEEVLRTEIITEARSPIDGRPLSAGEFAELVTHVEAQIDRELSNSISEKPEFKELVYLLRLRSFLKSIGIPIK